MEWFRYSLPLKSPLQLPGVAPLTSREGLLLHDPQTNGWGDAAPLPGVSPETLDEVVESVKQDKWSAERFPSLRFALSCLKGPLRSPERAVEGNGLWITAMETVSQMARRLEAWRHPLLKVKPGKDPDITALLSLLERRPDVRYRIDGNRQWSVEQTLQVVRALPEESLEYVEEPLLEPEGYEALWARHPVPIALDESLTRPEGVSLADHQHVVAFILKPTLLGGESDWAPWLEKGRSGDKDIVWSSCFESGVGLWHLARLAEGGVAAGLDTGNVFKDDLVIPRPLLSMGVLAPTSSLEVSHAFLPA